MMNMLMNHKKTQVATMVFVGLFGVSTLAAQETLDRSQLPRPAEDRASCQDVDWNQSLLTDYPWVTSSCHEVIIAGGQRWARFEAQFEGMNRDGTFDVNFLNRTGSGQGVISLQPRPDQTVLIDEREYQFSELSRNQKLNFYVPEGAYAFAVAPGAEVEELVEVVEPRTAAAEPVRLARAEPRQASRPTTLPATAGPLPLLGLGGVFALLGGLGMTLRRRSSRTID